MIDFFLTILIISSIGAALALILVLCEKYIVNYGPCKVMINDDRELDIQGGNPLLTVLRDEKIFIPSACGGRGTCGVCKCTVKTGGGAVLPTETPFLTKEEIADSVRLSCQVKVRETDLHILAPVDVAADATNLIVQYRTQLENYLARCPAFIGALSPLSDDPTAVPMIRAGWPAERATCRCRHRHGAIEDRPRLSTNGL